MFPTLLWMGVKSNSLAKQQVDTIYPQKKIDITMYIHVVQLQNTVWDEKPESGSKTLLGVLSQNGTSSFFSDGAQL